MSVAPARPGPNLVRVDTLDPATSTIYTGAQVYDNIFSKLIDIDENNAFYGVLATAWNQVDEPLPPVG